MAYNITISPLVDLELAEAYGYYADISVKVLKMFDKDILAVMQHYNKIRTSKLGIET